MSAIHLDPKDVPVNLRGDYRGKLFKAEIANEVTIPADAGMSEGGTVERFFIVRLADGKQTAAVNHNASPFGGARRETIVKVEPGFAVVRHSHFCGKDTGLTFYINPANAPILLPGKVEISAIERTVLRIVGAVKSSYRTEEFARAGIAHT